MAERSPPTRNQQVSDPKEDLGADIDNAGKQGRWDKSLARIRRTPAGRFAFTIAVAIVGAIVTAVGLLLVPLPGPGWLIVFAGLAIWSIEFRWARRLRVFTVGQVTGWTRWYTRQGWLLRIVVGFLTVVVVLGVIGASVYVSFGASAFEWIPFGG